MTVISGGDRNWTRVPPISVGADSYWERRSQLGPDWISAGADGWGEAIG
ncbi:MAG: hypothetical protein ACRCU2_12005 [Planktothrix sp.]